MPADAAEATVEAYVRSVRRVPAAAIARRLAAQRDPRTVAGAELVAEARRATEETPKP